MPPSGSDLLTHSRMTAYKTCQRMHYFRYELGVRRVRTARTLRMGSAIHLGLDERARGRSEDDAILLALAGYEELPQWCNTPEAMYDWTIEREVVARLLCGYFWRWKNADDGVQIVESEVSFRLPIINPATGHTTPTFQLGGKRDKIIKLADGRLAIREHKTCSEDLSAESDYWKRLRIDQQITTYYISALDQGFAIQTVQFDVIRKPTIRPSMIPLLDEQGLKIVLDPSGERVRTKDGKKFRESGDAAAGYVLQSRRETPTEFGERITDDIEKQPEKYYARQEIPRLESDLLEFREELWQIQLQLRESQRTGRHFRNTAACRQFNQPCEYFDACTNGTSLEGELPAGFERVAELHPELVSVEESEATGE